MWSTVRIATGAVVDARVSPSCCSNARRNVGPASSCKASRGSAGSRGESTHSRLKSKVPLRPVSSVTGRSIPVNGLVINAAIRAIVTSRPPMRPLSGELAVIRPILPHENPGSCKPDVREGGCGRPASRVGGGVAPVHAPFPPEWRWSWEPVCPCFSVTNLKAGLICRSMWVASLKRSVNNNCIMRRI